MSGWVCFGLALDPVGVAFGPRANPSFFYNLQLWCELPRPMPDGSSGVNCQDQCQMAVDRTFGPSHERPMRVEDLSLISRLLITSSCGLHRCCHSCLQLLHVPIDVGPDAFMSVTFIEDLLPQALGQYILSESLAANLITVVDIWPDLLQNELLNGSDTLKLDWHLSLKCHGIRPRWSTCHWLRLNGSWQQGLLCGVLMP